MRADDRDSRFSPGKVPVFRLSFLGAEFLTWLYFYVDHIGGEIPLIELLPKWPSNEQTLRIGIGKRMTLKPLSTQEMRMSIAGISLDDSGEVLQAIRAGAYIDALSLDFIVGERVHHVLIQADGSMSQVKTEQAFSVADDEEKKEIAEKVNWEEAILLKISNLDEIEDLIDGLFAQFMSRRLAHVFTEQDLVLMRKAVAEGLVAKLPKITKSTDYQPNVDEELLTP